MNDIVEAVAKSINDTSDRFVPGWHDLPVDERKALSGLIASAAIVAYEAEKAKQAAWAEKLGKDSIRRFQENNR